MNKRIVLEFYVLSALGQLGLGFMLGTYVVFLREHGLDLFQVNMVNLAYYVMLTICEIPTGIFADIFGRKSSYLASCILMAIGLLIYASSGKWVVFILAESVIAIGATFRSGAFKAWFVDRIRHDGYDGSLHKIFARASQLQRLSSIIAVLVGSASSEIYSTLPFIMGAGAFLINAVVAAFIKEEYHVRKKVSLKMSIASSRIIVRNSFKICRDNKAVRFIMALVSVQFLAIQTVNMHWQPFFNEWLDNKTFFGFIMVGINLSLLLGNWVAPFIQGRVGCEKKSLLLCQTLIAIFIIATSLCSNFPVALLLFYVHEVFRGAYAPINDTYLHENISSKERATISSFESLAQHGAGMIGLLVSGLLAKNLGVSITWFMIGCFLLFSTLIFTRKGRS